MKRIYILFGILICTACLAYGQNSTPVSLISEISDPANLVTKSIIKDYNGIPIAYIEKGGRHYFTAAIQGSYTNSIELKKAEINTAYSVKDFVFNGKDLYCCGTYMNEHGFIGYVKIADFIESNRFDFLIYKDFKNQFKDYHHVKDLTKLVFYQYSDLFYIVTIGKTIDEYYKEKGCTMAIVMSPDGTKSYKVGESSASQEVFNDIVATPNYVVTVGSTSSSPDAAIRRFTKHSILTSQPYSSTIYKYPTVEDDSTLHVVENINDFLITKVMGDTIAIASYWYIPPSANLGTNLKGTLLRIYNLNTPSAPNMMTSMSINQTFYTNNWKLKELQYNDILQTFTLLQNRDISQNSVQSTITRLKFNPISIQSEYYNNIELTSSDNIEGSAYYLISGYSKPTANKYFMIKNKLDYYNQGNTCGIYNNENITFKNIYTYKTENVPLNTFGTNFNFIHIGYISITTEIFNNSCIKY